MKVRAIGRGFSGVSREPGDVFEIKSEKLFSSRWMERFEPEMAKVTPAAPPPPLEGEVPPPPPIGPTADGTPPKPPKGPKSPGRPGKQAAK